MPPIAPRPKPEPYPSSPYRLHPRIAAFFREFVSRPFEKHAPTKAWVREVVKTEWGYQAGLIDNGRSTFSEPRDGLPPEDLVLIYCYRYMQMHTVSGFHMYLRNLVDCKVRMLKNPIFIDFGCGPLTSGISLAWYGLVANKKHTEEHGLRVNYIGIDRSEAMLAHAQRASVTGNLFHSKSTFDFMTRANAPLVVPSLIKKYRAAYGGKPLTVVLNCSYYFGSKTLGVPALVRFIADLVLRRLPEDKVCLTFQNANHSVVNEKWDEFKTGVKGILTPYSSAGECLEYFDITGRRMQRNPQPIKLLRELLLNKNFKDELEAK
jgi:hypothetical protein